MKIEGITVWKEHEHYMMDIEYYDGKGDYPTKRKDFDTIADVMVSVAYYLKRGDWGK